MCSCYVTDCRRYQSTDSGTVNEIVKYTLRLVEVSADNELSQAQAEVSLFLHSILVFLLDSQPIVSSFTDSSATHDSSL